MRSPVVSAAGWWYIEGVVDQAPKTPGEARKSRQENPYPFSHSGLLTEPTSSTMVRADMSARNGYTKGVHAS